MAQLRPKTTNESRNPVSRRRGVLLAALLLAQLVAVSMGAPGGGIGGTGITGFGPIQRFGSIFVNGREYFLGAATHYRVDGRSAGRAALHVGDTVVVQGTGDPARATARAKLVLVRHALVGRVDAVTAGGTRLTVFGQRVRIPRGVPVAGAHGRTPLLRRGDWVAVSALADGRGGWVATRVAVRYRAHAVPAGARAVLEGSVTAIAGDGVLRIGRQAVRIGRGAGPAPRPGARVRVVGRYRDGVILAARIGPARPALGAPGRYVEMEGYPMRGARDTLRSNDVVLHGATRLGAPAHDQLRAGRALLFSGRVGRGGTLELERIGPPRAPRPLRTTPETDAHQHPGREGDETKGAGRPDVEPPGIEHPEIEHPQVERPQIELPEVERPQLPGIELPDR